MASYTVDLSDLANAAEQLDGATRRVEQAVYDLKAQVAKYTAENQGQAIDNYAAVQQQWDAGVEQVRQGNAKATSTLRTIGENYEAGDREGAAIFVA